MSDDSSNAEKENEVLVLLEALEVSSGEDPPMSEWSSLQVKIIPESEKRVLYSQGLYSPGSGEICAKYIAQSDSDVLRQPYYLYPGVTDPGIKEAILHPEKPIVHGNDGQSLYLALCEEMDCCPVRLFHRGLLTDDINLSYYCVSSKGIRPMALALQFNKFVKKLNLTDSFLDDDACYHLGQMLGKNSSLKELNLNGCRIGASGLERLMVSLPINLSLEELNLSRNELKDEGGIKLGSQISNGITIKRLDISRNQLGRLTALSLAESFEFGTKITHLDLSGNFLYQGPSTARMLAMLANSQILESLNMSWNAMEGERVAESINKILAIKTLRYLDLSNNSFKGADVPILSADLHLPKLLHTLNLSRNPFTPEDALVILKKLLKPRVKLQKLLMAGIWGNKDFLGVLNRVRAMKSRANFEITFDGVLHNYTYVGPDPRLVLLKRANYLGSVKKPKVDIVMFLLEITKRYGAIVDVKKLKDIVIEYNIPLDDGFVDELVDTFRGPKSGKIKKINLNLVVEYIARLWPDKRLPPTPPPEPEPEPEPVPEPPKKEKKGKGKK